MAEQDRSRELSILGGTDGRGDRDPGEAGSTAQALSSEKEMAQLLSETEALALYVGRHGDVLDEEGITYDAEEPPHPSEYAKAIIGEMNDLDCTLILEPGRVIVGNAGILVTRVLYTKDGPLKRFVIADAGMSDLIRPSLYDSFHAIQPVEEAKRREEHAVADLVGPICESGDTFARGRPMPPVGDGALIAFRSAGAYGAVMSSEYNSRPLIPEVLVKGDHFAVIRARPSFDEILARDTIPEWL